VEFPFFSLGMWGFKTENTGYFLLQELRLCLQGFDIDKHPNLDSFECENKSCGFGYVILQVTPKNDTDVENGAYVSSEANIEVNAHRLLIYIS